MLYCVKLCYVIFLLCYVRLDRYKTVKTKLDWITSDYMEMDTPDLHVFSAITLTLIVSETLVVLPGTVFVAVQLQTDC